IVVGGLLDPQRMQRLAVISRQDGNALSPQAVISALVASGFASTAKTPAERDLAAVVQSEIAERLMILAVNPEATPEVQAIALAGVHQAKSTVKKTSARTSGL